MDVLHAPWRIEYILAPKPAQDESLFTRIAQSNDDDAHHVIARRKTCYALLNTYPYNGGHLMVVPYRQVPELHDLTDEESAELMKLTQECITALKRCMKPDGFNVGMIGDARTGALAEVHEVGTVCSLKSRDVHSHVLECDNLACIGEDTNRTGLRCDRDVGRIAAVDANSQLGLEVV